MVKATKRKKNIFDYEADWVPQKGRVFTMKASTKEEDQREDQRAQGDKIKTDAEGEDRAYAQGDTYVEDNKLFVAGSHTLTDWFDDVTKIPQWQYVPPGLNVVIDFMNSWLGKKLLGTGDLRQAERYKAGREALLSNKKIDWVGGHSLGGAVALQLQKDFPNRVKQTVTWGAPVWDPLGTQKAEVGQENIDRKSNRGDLVSIFDNSAKKTNHPNAFSSGSLWHDYHNTEEAGGTLGGRRIVPKTAPKMNTIDTTTPIVPNIDNTTKETWETQPFESAFQALIPYSLTEEKQEKE
jgi:hypothetical protein